MNVKRFSLARIVIVFLAGIILIVNTACSQSPSASASRGTYSSGVADEVTEPSNNSANKPYSAQPTKHASDKSGNYPLEKIQAEHMKESYSTTEAVPGTMNNFKDTEPGVDKAGAKASYLVEQAKKNLDKRAGSPPEAVENLKETASLNKVGDKLNQYSDSLNNTAEGVKEGAKKGFQNLKQNVKSAADDVSDSIQ
ncbi:hypothetical protein C7H19_14160 [Aphanothece hegewaldii CCALA 016]|uniref:Uncharacterized protein n=1 Tax=Aphanothece hegewaldii CCALA 016 TaxID=2107694 RepID=A0A2T1LWF7_9CHRO|nr:hypothetical protein [Aphanothece hegewaldii]PSF36138.1 hypothetical protein C7H19_14160 [Aphanothece hegewaldii CCALA 016]